MQHVEVARVVEAPPQVVWDRYTDHAGWTAWAGLGKVTIARQGRPAPNGVGCQRVFHTGVSTVEEVISFEPPSRMTYRLVRGPVPITDHLGEVLFEPHPRGTRIVWRCRFEATMPMLGTAMARALEALFTRLLDRFAQRALADRGGVSVRGDRVDSTTA